MAITFVVLDLGFTHEDFIWIRNHVVLDLGFTHEDFICIRNHVDIIKRILIVS